MLIVTDKHDEDELARWRALERQDEVTSRLGAHKIRVKEARQSIRSFALSGPSYAGVSWGKDSVCLAHLCVTEAPEVPLVWVRIEPVANPECLLVRDAFLKSWPSAKYDEILIEYLPGETEWHDGYGPQKTRLHRPAHQRGFAVAAKRYGARHISGIRARESSARANRMKAYGHSTANTCAPMGWWEPGDVFAYLRAHNLPVHPAYAYTMHGGMSRDRIRVDALWGPTGTGHGRREWERRYYPTEFRHMKAWCQKQGVEVDEATIAGLEDGRVA